MTQRKTHISSAALLALMVSASGPFAQDKDPFAPPTRAWEQGSIFQNTIPETFETHILAETSAELEVAARVMRLYEILIEGATPEKLKGVVSDEYIQHSVFLPNGPAPLAELFGMSVEERTAEGGRIYIDVHRVIVSGNYAFAH
ncbi:MAG: hypothetical protein AAFR02_07680, partial [Pseudomonadota bacterium]